MDELMVEAAFIKKKKTQEDIKQKSWSFRKVQLSPKLRSECLKNWKNQQQY